MNSKQTHRIERVRKRQSDADFMNSQTLENNRQLTRVFMAVIFIVAAVTTFSFGLLGSWGDVDLNALPPKEFWQMIWQGLAAALVVTALLDGCRYGWRLARLAAKTMPAMQWLSLGMEAITFGASLSVSMLGLPPLLTYLGLDLIYDQEMIRLVLTYVLQISLGINLLAAFLYIMLSPESMKLMKTAHLASQREQVYLLKFSKILNDVIKGEGREIEEFLSPIAADWIQDGAAGFLDQNGYAQLPPTTEGGKRYKQRDSRLHDASADHYPVHDPRMTNGRPIPMRDALSELVVDEPVGNDGQRRNGSGD